jgi:hypothetical protein
MRKKIREQLGELRQILQGGLFDCGPFHDSPAKQGASPPASSRGRFTGKLSSPTSNSKNSDFVIKNQNPSAQASIKITETACAIFEGRSFSSPFFG